MSYQKRWVSPFTHKSLRMMTMCTGTVGKYLSQITVEPVLFLYMLSTFSQYALFQDLVYSKVCWSQHSKESGVCEHLHNPEYKDELEIVQKTSSHWILMSTISLVAPSLIIAMYLGSWSDRYGRKWPVVFPTFGGVCACLVYIYISIEENSPVGLICLASLLSGLTGGFVSCIMSCMTYVASVTTEETRTVRISRLEAMTFLGGTIGPFISGTMLESTGHAYAFFYMMLCYAFAFLYAIFFVKDIDKDGLPFEKKSKTTIKTHEISDEEDDDDSHSKSGSTKRRRNKSSDTIPSSVVATTMSTTSGGEDMEQRCHLLSASDLHVAAEAGSSSPTDFTSQHQDDLDYPDIPRISPVNENEELIIAVVSDHHNGNENRHSVGSSSGRNSSLHGHDDGSSAASDDDQRRMLRNSEHSNEVISNEEKEGCMKYFGTGHCLSAVKTVAKKRENGRRTLLLLSLLAGFMFMVITAGEMDVAYLFAKAEPLKWSFKTFSYYFGFKYGFGTFVLLVATPVLQKMGVEDATLAIIGIVSRMAALVLYGLSVNTYMAFSVPAVAVFSVFTIPATRSLLSKLVNQDEQGKMFAFVALMEDICTLSASLIFNSIYPVTRSILEGLIFLLAAASLVVPILIMGFVRWKMLKIQKMEQSSPGIAQANLRSIEGPSPADLISSADKDSVTICK